MMNKTLYTFLVLLISLGCQAQYYYKDIVMTRQTMDELALLKEQKIRSVGINSFETNGEPSEGFFCEKSINKSFTKLEIRTETSTLPTSFFSSWFDKEGTLIKTSDSSEAAVTLTTYMYTEKNQLSVIKSNTRHIDEDYSDDDSEQHLYFYDASGLPEKMLFIKNLKDTTTILFQADESKKTAIEKNTRTGDIYYYYYNTKGWISDVVHNYATRKKMVTDFTFEYNSAGKVVQMISSEAEGAFYFTWKYSYDNGLRTGERCYSKEGRLQGTIEYVYK
jgi:uncharacterized protein YcfL